MTGFEIFMTGWGWAAYSLIAAFFLAALMLVTQYMKQSGHMLVFWMRVSIVLMLTPLMPYIDFPRSQAFYLATFVTVFMGVIADIRVFNVSVKYGSGVASRIQPLVVWGAFFAWFALDPGLVWKYLDHPVNTAGVLLALFGCVWFSQRLKKCHITRAAVVEITPALVGYVGSTIMNKFAMEHGAVDGSYEGAVFAYMYVQSILAVVVLAPYAAWREKTAGKEWKPWRTRKMAVAALSVAAFWILSMAFRNYAMAYVESPSYPAALNLTAPVFIAVFYYFKKHKEEADVASGMGVVACAMLLALMTVHK